MTTNCIDITDKKSKVKKTLCSMAMLSTDHEANIEHWKEQINFFADKCYKKLPSLPPNNGIINLRAKQLADAEVEALAKSKVVPDNV